jgi:cell division septation protein DedD
VRAPEPAANSSTPDQGDYYHVVTDYNSDRALEQARQVVPDAYVRNFPEGAQVQLGAFNDAQKAQGLVQELQEKGIPAQVQQR